MTRALAGCDHSSFFAQVDVTRLTDGDDGPVTGYSADIVIKCDECHLAFQFVGVPGGYSPAQPMVSPCGTELRAPIAPSEIPARPVPMREGIQ